jgi:hypothetical protein
MTRKRTLSAALATTASVALLAGLSPAQAQMGGTPGGPCSTTLESPAMMNCTLPSSKAPGAGSFPGSFLVPGTTTSFAVHGLIQMDIAHNLGPNTYDGSLAPPLEGAAGHSENGGTFLNSAPTRPNIETRTPTAYGELKTYIEFDFGESNNGTYASTSPSSQTLGNSNTVQNPGNQGVARLRQAYGTLGPFLAGQTKTLFDDPAEYPDIADAGLEAGMRTSTIVHRPQVRYTYLAGNGITVAGSLEMPTKNVIGVYSAGASSPTAVTGDGAGSISTSSIVQIPDAVLAAQWDQPWGHLKLAGTYHESIIDNVGTGTFANTAGNRSEVPGYAFHLSGHVNAWGKDALRGEVQYDKGIASDNSSMSDDRLVGAGGYRGTISALSGDANYEHFFSSQWRSNISAGISRSTVSTPTTAPNGLAAVNGTVWTGHVNVIYSPVPQTDFITEVQHETIHELGGSYQTGKVTRLYEQFKFYF